MARNRVIITNREPLDKGRSLEQYPTNNIVHKKIYYAMDMVQFCR